MSSRRAAPSMENLNTHRKLFPDCAFKNVAVVNVTIGGPDGLRTENFIDKVSEFSQRPEVKECGGFMVIRPTESTHIECPRDINDRFQSSTFLHSTSGQSYLNIPGVTSNTSILQTSQFCLNFVDPIMSWEGEQPPTKRSKKRKAPVMREAAPKRRKLNPQPSRVSNGTSTPRPQYAQHDRGFALKVMQFEDERHPISTFWADEKAFTAGLEESPYDNVPPEDTPLVFMDFWRKKNSMAIYGLMDDTTLYSEDCPFQVSRLRQFGPFQALRDDECMLGIQTPYVYVGNTHTFFPWHREDMNFYAMNHLLWGQNKIWFCIRPTDTWKVMRYVREQYHECGNCSTPVQHKVFWFDPYCLTSMGIDVFFIRQQPGDIVITPPGGFHAGFNAGPNIAESVNFMTWDWFSWQTTLSAMQWFCKNRCELCEQHVFLHVNKLAERLRIDAKTRDKTPSKDKIHVLPALDGKREMEVDEESAKILSKTIVIRGGVVASSLESLWASEPYNHIEGEQGWVYPVRSQNDEYCRKFFPGLWMRAAPAEDTLLFEILYNFQFLGFRKYNENIPSEDVIWELGMPLENWKRGKQFDESKLEGTKWETPPDGPVMFYETKATKKKKGKKNKKTRTNDAKPPARKRRATCVVSNLFNSLPSSVSVLSPSRPTATDS